MEKREGRVEPFLQTLRHSTFRGELLVKVAGERPILILIPKICWDMRTLILLNSLEPISAPKSIKNEWMY